jgi:hypothetical protein
MYAANNPESPIPNPTIPLDPIQNHWVLVATGKKLSIKRKCVAKRKPTAIRER